MPMFLSAEQLIIRGFVAHCRVLCRCSKYYRATQRSCFETETWIYVIFRSGHSIRHQGLSEFIGNTSNQWWICRGIMKPCPFLLSLFFFFLQLVHAPRHPWSQSAERWLVLHVFILFSILSVVTAVSVDTLWGAGYEKPGLCLNTSRIRIIIILFCRVRASLACTVFCLTLGTFL